MHWSYGILIGLVSLYGLWVGVSQYEHATVEKLKYHVLEKIEDKDGKHEIQIRQYPSYLTAEATYYSLDMQTAMNFGFKDIAGYIFGDNVAPDQSGPEKIAMTAPVTIQETEETLGYTVSFVMPAEWTIETLPIPNNKKVAIQEVPAQKMASISWHGNVPTEKHVQEKEEELRKVLKEHGYKTKGESFLFEYDPPFSPGWMRLNEVLFAIEETIQTK